MSKIRVDEIVNRAGNGLVKILQLGNYGVYVTNSSGTPTVVALADKGVLGRSGTTIKSLTPAEVYGFLETLIGAAIDAKITTFDTGFTPTLRGYIDTADAELLDVVQGVGGELAGIISALDARVVILENAVLGQSFSMSAFFAQLLPVFVASQCYYKAFDYSNIDIDGETEDVMINNHGFQNGDKVRITWASGAMNPLQFSYEEEVDPVTITPDMVFEVADVTLNNFNLTYFSFTIDWSSPPTGQTWYIYRDPTYAPQVSGLDGGDF